MPRIPANDNHHSDAASGAPSAAECALARDLAHEPGVALELGQVVLIASGNGSIVHLLQAPTGFDETAVDALIGTNIDKLWPNKPSGQLTQHSKRAIRSRRVESLEIPLATGGGHYDFVFIPNGPDRVMVVGRDVSERTLALSRLEKLAYFDDVTQLPNQQLLLDEIGRCTETLRLTEGRAAVICLNVSTIGFVSSTSVSHQHDLLFKELATRLTHCLRDALVMGSDDGEGYSTAARTDYGQFGILLQDIESGSDAERIAEQIIEALKEPVDAGGRKVRFSAHAGVALFPQDGRDADTLYSNALAAMEDAITMKVSCKLHSGTLRLRALQRQDIEAQLRTALEHNGFAVEFLPVVDAESRRIVSVEALLRWPQNVFNALSISDVVSVAENTGLIRRIGDWVLRESCRALKSWHEAGWSDLRLSVNLSTQEFAREDTPERMASILSEFDIPTSLIDVEINEYSLYRDAIRDYQRSKALRELGVGVVVDDYGTGACSLRHLSQSPVETIKVDRSFVAGLGDRQADRDACAAIVALAKKLGMRTIAEGVETEKQAQFLLKEGCTYLQGFLTCMPTTVEGILDVLSKGQPS